MRVRVIDEFESIRQEREFFFFFVGAVLHLRGAAIRLVFVAQYNTRRLLL